MYRIAQKAITNMAEKHYYEQNNNGDFTNGAAELLNLTNLGQGDSAVTRTGNKIQPTSFRFRCTCDMRNGGTIQYDIIRIMVVQWMEDQTDHAFTADDPIQGTATGNPQNVLAVYAQTDKRSFRVLYDTTRVLDYSKQRVARININIPGRRIKPLTYSGAVQAEGQLFVIMMSQQMDGTGANFIDFHSQSMLRYTDV